MSFGFGGGDAWAKDHDKILKHAEGLKYPEWLAANNQAALPAADAPKEEWISAMDKFNAWKAGEVAKEDSGQAWWQTFSASPSPESGGGGGVGGGSTNPDPELGPFPNENIYFPILETEYTAPAAQDFSQYMPIDGLLTGGAQARYPQAVFPPLDEEGGVLSQTPSEPITGGQQFDIGGLLYQPWSTEYQQAFVPGNIWQYDPNQFGVGEVSYVDNPYGSLKLPEDWEDLLGPFEEEEDEDPPTKPENAN
tara:strand:- start:5853 stop:6602 length:750 start_codon:yes stop_codon:yes gene_type:complete